MILKYGTTVRPLGEVAVTISRKAERDSGQRWYATRETWNIEGLITTRVSPESAARTYIKQQQRAVESMFSVDGRDLKLMFPDGRTVSHHQILNSSTLGGVRIVNPVSFPKSAGTEGVTVRTYQVTLEGLLPIGDALVGNVVLDFEESCQYEGGGYRDIMVESKLGRPQRQRGRRFTAYRVVQRGSATGLYTRPTPPSPIWPAYMMDEEPAITRGHPRREGTALTHWPITWQYMFSSAYRLSGVPNEWGQTYGR